MKNSTYSNLPSYATSERIDKFIQNAIAEDLGDGDHSTLASVTSEKIGKAQCIVKEDCLLAGVQLAQMIFHHYDKNISMSVIKNDGERATKGETIFIVEGNAQSILSMERLVLNCMQRMSGIATFTHTALQSLKDSKTILLDTRKTTPLFRLCEKWAVYIGGAENHRMGLYDMIMLKDNHNDYAGGITNAVEATQKYLKQIGKNLKIEVETRNLTEVREALNTNAVDIIMLDNMDIDTMKEAVRIIDGKAKTEASGGIQPEQIKEIAQIGIDYISSGSIIYSAPIIDISLKAI